MNVPNSPDAYEEGECPAWAWPLYALVALLACILDYITKLKRVRHTTKFKPDWRDSWQDLRHAEWIRDQLIAQGVQQLLNNETLQLDDTKLIFDPPASYGGPCPRTPFDMNRRFLALARWAADPHEIIRERFKRLVTRPGINPANPFATHASTDAARAAAQHKLVGVSAFKTSGALALILSSARSARPSKGERVLANARGPPSIPISRNPSSPNPEAHRFRERFCAPKAPGS